MVGRLVSGHVDTGLNKRTRDASDATKKSSGDTADLSDRARNPTGTARESSGVSKPQRFRRLVGMGSDSVFEEPAHLWLALRDWHLGWRTQVRITMQRQFGRSSAEEFLSKYHSPGLPVAILLPGVWERWEVLKTWAKALAEAGFDVHLLPEFDMQIGTLSDLGTRLANYLETNALEDVLIVAHSKGGLVAKSAMVGVQGWRIRRLISCGTPYAGAPIAQLSPPSMNMRSLVPWNGEIEGLAKKTDTNPKIVAIRAAWDQNVPPSNDLTGARNVTVPVTGHNRLLDAPETAAAIKKYATF